MKTEKYISLEKKEPKNPFSVPENYFEQFATQFETRIAQTPTPRHKLIRPWMYIAASLVLIFSIGQFTYNTHQENNTQIAENYELYVLSQVDETSMMDYYLDENTK